MIPGSQALLISIFPESKRTTALGVWSMTTFNAPIAGPILGGYISDNFHWGRIFLINVPVGLFCAFVCWPVLSKRETPPCKLPIDTIAVAMPSDRVCALQHIPNLGKNVD